MIQFGPEFAPDRMKFASGVSTNIINCLPINDGWGPIPQPVVVSDDGDPSLGAVYVRRSDGGYRIFKGTATQLLELNQITFEWDDVSRLSGGDYAATATDRWWFVVFGANLLAGNLNDNPQYIDIDAGTNFALLTGSPPKAKYAWVAGSQVFLGHIDGFPTRVMSSGIGDATFWTQGRRSCDFQDFPDGEEVMGGYGAQGGAVLFQKTKIRGITLQQGDVPWRADVINDARGVLAPYSIAKIGPGSYVYLCQDGFFKDVAGQPIGIERVNEWFFREIDRSRLDEVRAMVAPDLTVVLWTMPLSNGSSALLGYRWPFNRWFYSNAAITDMASLVTTGITIDGLDSIYATIDDIDVPIDSLDGGGDPRTAVFDSSNRLCYLTGSPMAATLETPDTQLTPGGRTWLNSARVVTDATGFSLKTITSDFHGDSRNVSAAVSPYSATAICHFRSSALMHGFRMEIPAGTEWTHATGVDFPDGGFRPEGQR